VECQKRCRTDLEVAIDEEEEITARGAKLDEGVKDEEWGRHISVTDPDGFKITIANEKKTK